MTDEDTARLRTSFSKITPEWLAGFFDGEGCVSAYSNKLNGYNRISVILAQKDSIILRLIMAKFPGYYFNDKGKTPQVVWSGKNCIRILEFIKDHVIVKHSQVVAGLELAYMMKNKGDYVSPSEVKDRLEIHKKITGAKKDLSLKNYPVQ